MMGIAQRSELDSLLHVLAAYPNDDTVKLNLLNDIAFDYSYIAPAKGKQFADEAISLAEKLHQPSKLAAAYNYKGLNCSAQGDDTLALAWYKRALALHMQTGNTLRIGTTYNNIAISLVNLSKYPEALEYHGKALAIFERLHEVKRVAASLNNIGVIYLYVADYNKALEYYFKALTLAEQQRGEEAIKDASTNIGLVYDHLSNFQKALEYHNRAAVIARKEGDKRSIANSLGNLGNVYHDMDSSAKAIALYRQALAINETLGDKRGIASCYGNLGIVYNSTGDYGKALEYIEKSLQLNTAAQDKQRIAGDLLQLARLYMQVPAAFITLHGMAPANRYDKVINYANKSIAVGKDIGSIDLQRDAWEVLSNTYEKQYNASKALDAYKQYIILRDSVLNEGTKLAIARRDMQYDFEKKQALTKADNDKKQAIAGIEIHRQQVMRNISVGVTLTITVAAFTTLVFYKKKRDAEELQKETEFKIQVTDTELKALRAQMNPHFIFNSLNAIADYVQKFDAATATGYTAGFARLMRIILENSERKEVTLAEDLEALELYMQLEQLRLRYKFTYSVHIDKAIDKDITFIPPLLLQPFVENSIWHGIANTEGTGHINVSIVKQGDLLECTIEDNGVGNTPAGIKKETGKPKSRGIEITKQRIDILNRQKKINAEVLLTFPGKGARATLTLPLETDL